MGNTQIGPAKHTIMYMYITCVAFNEQFILCSDQEVELEIIMGNELI